MADEIQPGDYYEDCRYEPVLCIETDYAGDSLRGISLLTGQIGDCSPIHCGIEKLSFAQAVARRRDWPAFAASLGLPGSASPGQARRPS